MFSTNTDPGTRTACVVACPCRAGRGRRRSPSWSQAQTWGGHRRSGPATTRDAGYGRCAPVHKHAAQSRRRRGATWPLPHRSSTRDQVRGPWTDGAAVRAGSSARIPGSVFARKSVAKSSASRTWRACVAASAPWGALTIDRYSAILFSARVAVFSRQVLSGRAAIGGCHLWASRVCTQTSI